MKTFEFCRMKPKPWRCGKYLHLELCTEEEMEIIEHYSDKQTLKKLVIVHVFVATMTELCIYGSFWWEEFKWAWLVFLTYLKNWSNFLRKDIFLRNTAYFSKGISINWHPVSYQSLALQGFLVTSSLTRAYDTRLLGQTFLALKKPLRMGKQRCYLTSLVRPFDVRSAVANPVSHSGSEWILGLSDYRSYQP